MAAGVFNLGLLSRPDVPERKFKAGEVIFQQGTPATELFVIKAGRVEIRHDGHVVAELGENELFGEMALIDKTPRSATATAITDAELIPVSEKQFLFLVSETPYFALAVMRVLADRLRAKNKTNAG